MEYYNINISQNIKNIQENYIKFSKIKENSQKTFIDKISKINKKTGEIFKYEYDFMKNQKNNYEYLVQRTKYLQNQIIASGEDMTGFFITLTLGSEHHPFKDIIKINGEKHYKNYNPKYNSDLTVHDGYEELKEVFRKIQKDMKIKKKITLKFIKVFEYHSSMTAHLHGVVFVPTEYVEYFKEHVERMLGNKTKETILTKKKNKTIYKTNKYVGRSEMEQINDISRVVPYLIKYIKKSMNGENEEYAHLLNGWKKKNKIRLFTMSNVGIPRFIFKKLYNVLGKKIDRNKDDFNLIEEIENISDISINYYKNDKDYKIKSYLKTSDWKFYKEKPLNNTDRHFLKDNKQVSKLSTDYLDTNEIIRRKEYVGNNVRYRVEIDIKQTDMIKYTNNITMYSKTFIKEGFMLKHIMEDFEFFEDNRFDDFEDFEEYEIKEYLKYLEGNNPNYNQNEEHLKNMSDWCEKEGIVEVEEKITSTEYMNYKVVNFIITDLKTNKIIYNNNDFEYKKES